MCGAFLIVGDAQSRVDDHLMGKQHMGYAKIKSTVEELKVTQSCQNIRRLYRDRVTGDLIHEQEAEIQGGMQFAFKVLW